MRKWSVAVVIICLFFIGSECQEPEEILTTSRKSNQNELFKFSSESTITTDINTTTLSSSTEIESNSTTATSVTGTHAADTVSELEAGTEELSHTRDDEITTHSVDVEVAENEDTVKTEWTTAVASTQNEFIISIKDVFEHSLDAVNDEMKGIGIIQEWLKKEMDLGQDEEGVEVTTSDYTVEYTDVNEEYDGEEDNVVEGDKNKEEKEGTETPEESSTLAAQSDVLDRIEEDLEKLNELEVKEHNEEAKKEEIVKDIQENLNALEGIEDIEEETTTEEVSTTIVSSTKDIEEVPEESATLASQSDVLDKVEEDLEKLKELQVKEHNEEAQKETILKDIQENLNVLEGIKDIEEQTTTEEASTTIVSSTESDEDIEETTQFDFKQEELLDNEEEEDTTEIRTELKEEMTTLSEDVTETVTVTVEETTEPEVKQTTESAAENTEATEVAIMITNMVTETETETDITSQEISTVGNEAGHANETEPEAETEAALATTVADEREDQTSSTTEVSTATATTDASIEEEEETNTPVFSEEDFLIVTQTLVLFSDNEHEDKDLTLSVIPVHKVEVAKTTTTTADREELEDVEENLTTPSVTSQYDIVKEVFHEIIEEIKEAEEMATTTEATTRASQLLIEETVNLTNTIDKLLLDNEKTLDDFDIFVSNSNSIKHNTKKEEDEEEKEDANIFTDLENELQGLDNVYNTIDLLKNEEGQALDKDAIIKSIEEEFLTSDTIEKIDQALERKKILADFNSSDEDNAFDVDYSDNDDNDDNDVKEEVTREVSEPKVSAVIRNDVDANVCLNASGLSIKITTNNLTQWVPTTAFHLGDCTSFGAYLNFTWKSPGTGTNNSLSFTIIGDSEECYIEEVIFQTKNGAFIASQLEKYVTDPLVIAMSSDVKLTISHASIQLLNRKSDFATAPILSVDNALALQIASGGLCLFIVLIAVGIYGYRKLRSEARIFKVSLDK